MNLTLPLLFLFPFFFWLELHKKLFRGQTLLVIHFVVFAFENSKRPRR